MTRITLAAIVDRNAVAIHLDELRQGFAAGEPIEIACGSVEQIGLAGLQLLASAVRTGAQAGIPVILGGGAGAFTAAVGLAGMEAILLPAAGAGA